MSSGTDHSAEGPYRDTQFAPIRIAPDYRRRNAVLLVLLSMALGAMMVSVVSKVLRERPAHAVASREVFAVLSGPGGKLMLPGTQGAVVHIWMQACADCMPAFDAHKQLAESGGLRVPLPIVNVAYGRASPEWAASYGLAEHLVFDNGSSVVGPLGVSSFTTVVLDARGRVVLRDRPDRAGYAERVQAAAQVVATMQK
jgi:hypothetical protein